MANLIKNLVLVSAALMLSFSVLADDHETPEIDEKLQAVADKVQAAYGGDAIANLSGYRISDKFLTLTIGQSHRPDLMETAVSAQVLNYDIANNRSAYDTWFKGRDGGFQNSTISDGEKGHTVNHQSKKFGEAGNADPYVFAGGTMRTSDVILVRELLNNLAKATLGEDALFQNRNHHVVTLPFPSSPDLILYVDAESGLVSKMVRNNPQFGSLDYVYSGYVENDGITYANSTMFAIAGQPNVISQQRTMQFNPSFEESLFALPEGYDAEGERVDTTEMRATKLADRVYHVGQGNAYTLFVDTGASVVSTGGYAGLANRLAHFQKESGSYKPMSYQVVTHHHNDHIGGLGEALSAGAKLITVAQNIDAITAGVTPAPTSADFLSMGKRLTLGDGRNRVELYQVSTSHSDGYILAYVPAVKTVFTADHLGSPFATGTPVATKGTVTMLAAIDGLGIDVDRIATAHSARIFTMKEMRDSVNAYAPNTCGGDRPVCALMN